jgi:hypothetical protein
VGLPGYRRSSALDQWSLAALAEQGQFTCATLANGELDRGLRPESDLSERPLVSFMELCSSRQLTEAIDAAPVAFIMRGKARNRRRRAAAFANITGEAKDD